MIVGSSASHGSFGLSLSEPVVAHPSPNSHFGQSSLTDEVLQLGGVQVWIVLVFIDPGLQDGG